MSSPSIPLQRGRKNVVSPSKGEEIVVTALHHDFRRSRFLFPLPKGVRLGEKGDDGLIISPSSDGV